MRAHCQAESDRTPSTERLSRLAMARVVLAYIPAVVCGALVEFAGFTCPLTLLENDLRRHPLARCGLTARRRTPGRSTEPATGTGRVCGRGRRATGGGPVPCASLAALRLAFPGVTADVNVFFRLSPIY